MPMSTRNSARPKILGVLRAQRGSWLTSAEVARLSNYAVGTVLRHLAGLHLAGEVEREEVPRTSWSAWGLPTHPGYRWRVA